MTVGTVAAGRIGLAVLRRLKPFDVKLHYTDRHRLDESVEQELGLVFHPTAGVAGRSVRRGDDQRAVAPRDRGSLRRSLDREDEARCVSHQHGARQDLRPRRGRSARSRAASSPGYAGDVWFPQPAPSDHPWRTMPHHGMTPHISGSSLSAQARYAAGTREILECFFEGRPIRDEYLIVDGGQLAGTGAQSYTPGNATTGSDANRSA